MAGNKHSVQLKKLIISDYKKGFSQKDICKKFSLNKSTVSFIINKFKVNGTVETYHRGGRPKATTQLEDSRILIELKKYPDKSASSVVKALNLKVSSRTVQRRACAGGLRSYRAAKKPFISRKNRLKRLQFARDHINWSMKRWKTVLFSDESKFNLKYSDGMRRVRRPPNKRLDPRYCQGTVKHGGGNIMVWGCFSGFGIGPLHRINGIMDRFMYKDILESVMLPYAEWNMPLSWSFQHDNDPKHTAKLVANWFTAEKITVLNWPAQSPDLNPIENLWEIVNRKIDREGVNGDKDKLFEATVEAWLGISPQVINNLIASMPKRCSDVIKNNGYAIKY